MLLRTAPSHSSAGLPGTFGAAAGSWLSPAHPATAPGTAPTSSEGCPGPGHATQNRGKEAATGANNKCNEGNHSIVEPFRLEKTSTITECNPNSEGEDGANR